MPYDPTQFDSHGYRIPQPGDVPEVFISPGWQEKRILWIVLLFCGARIIEAFRDAQIFENPVEARDWLWHLLKFPQYLSLLLMGYVTRKWWWFADWTERIVATAGILASGWVVFETALKLWRKLL